jgi:hypothetical protein
MGLSQSLGDPQLHFGRVNEMDAEWKLVFDVNLRIVPVRAERLRTTSATGFSG